MTDKILEALKIGLENSVDLQISLSNEDGNYEAKDIVYEDINKLEAAIELYKSQQENVLSDEDVILLALEIRECLRSAIPYSTLVSRIRALIEKVKS